MILQRLCFVALVTCTMSCTLVMHLKQPKQVSNNITGEEFYRQAMTMQWKQRDSFAVSRIQQGNMPGFLYRLMPVRVSIIDSLTHQTIQATYFVTADYLSVGTANNWARIPLTPIAAQVIADSLHCFLPTRKMVNDIYAAATVKREPVPMTLYRDSSLTMWQHHQLIEAQRKGQTGLIAGIKKDVVISDQLTRSSKTNRVAIYGWHKPDGHPIQPLYTGHVNWYADYSHGIRLVYRYIRINGAWMNYAEVMGHPVLRKLLSDEAAADVLRY